MNLLKELVLEQSDRKRMGKWIRQRFSLIAGRLMRSGRKIILKLSEDWAYKEEYSEPGRRLEGLGLVKWKRENGKGMARLALVTR